MPRSLLFVLPFLCCVAGCPAPSTPPAAPVPVVSLPRHKHLQEVREAGAAELLRPAPSVSELTPGSSSQFDPPPAGSPGANYLTFLKDPRPTRGLVICEPQGAGNRAFGAGCARWMSAAGAGSTAFEVVPTWGMAEEFRHFKGWDSLALERGRAVQLGRGLDASHVAVGSYDGRSLRYQLLNVQKMPSTVAGSFEVKGSPAQIVAGLPQLARQLVNATGAKGAQVPARVELGTSDLSFLGTLPCDMAGLEKVPASQVRRLTRMANHPLGAIFIGRAQNVPVAIRQRAARTLLQVAPSNALAGGEVAMRFEGVEKERRVQVLRDLDRKFPRNEAIALGNASLRNQEGDYFARVHYAEMAVRVAPHSGVAWHTLAQAIGAEANEKRQGKYWPDMSRDEMAAVLKLYPRALVAAWMATQLNPLEANYWTELSEASTFASSDVWARNALAQALKRDPANSRALNWGLEIFQPKWFGDAASFATMARLAVAHAGQGEIDAVLLCDGLKRTDQEALRRPLLQKLIAKEPRNASALRLFSYATRMELGDFKAALPYARRAVQLEPNDTYALTELADIEQHDLGEYENSIKLFRRALKLEPQNPLH